MPVKTYSFQSSNDNVREFAKGRIYQDAIALLTSCSNAIVDYLVYKNPIGMGFKISSVPAFTRRS